MNQETVYKKARKLINERELDELNLDYAHDLLHELIEKDSKCDWAYGLLAEIYFWTGENAPPDEKLFNYETGVEYGEKGIEVNENSLEANFWLAVNYGSYGQEKGVMKSLSLVQPIKTCLDRVLAIDESYFYGGPWRVLGRLYHKAPGFPISIGNTKKAIECLERAVSFGPKFFLNHLFLAEACLTAAEKQKAREHLEWIVNAPLNKNHEIEDAKIKEDAGRLLSEI